MAFDGLYDPQVSQAARQLPVILARLAKQMGIHLIDIHQCFLKHESCGDVKVNCCDWEAPKPPKRKVRDLGSPGVCSAHEDAIHPNDEGYRNIALMVKRAVIDELEPC